MRRKTTAILILCLMLFCSCGRDAYVPAGFKMISDKSADFRMYVPTTWTEDLSGGICSAYYSKDDLSNVSFTALELNEAIIQVIHGKSESTSDTGESADTDNSPESGTADLTDTASTGETADTLPSSEGIATAEEYWDYYSAQFGATFSGMEYETEGENIVVSGLKSKKYVYTARVTGADYKFLQTVTVTNGTVYIFTYTARADSYDSHISDVEAILGYIEIK